MLLFTLTLIFCFATGRLLENTVPALDILGVLLDHKDFCYRAVYDLYYSLDNLYRRLPCPVPERRLLRWRAKCIAKMIMASDITDIRDETKKYVNI